MNRLFYAGLLYGEYESHWDIPTDAPEGSYLQMYGAGWWHKNPGWERIAYEDLPPEIKILNLIL